MKAIKLAVIGLGSNVGHLQYLRQIQNRSEIDRIEHYMLCR